jgi:transcriptional regulator with XRE-family HTH domain
MNATAIWPVPARPTSLFPAAVVPAPMGPLGMEVGTGGAATFVYVRNRGNKGYPFAAYAWSGLVADVIVGPTVIENISRIRAVLNPTVTDLAGTLGVSRQAIYDWQAGKPIAAENAIRLSDLARAADLFAVEGLRGTSQALRRPIKNGKNFFELVKEGSPADSAARGLIEIVRSEFHQREALRNRLAGRKRPSREAFGEIGAPMLDEKE